VIGFSLAAVAGCADLFGIEDVGQRIESGSGGARAAKGGSAGRAPGAAGGGLAGREDPTAGSSGDHAGEGGDASSGGDASVSGDGNGGGDAGRDSGTGGTGGMAGSSEPGTARLGTPCEGNVDACSDASPFLLLRCRDGVWDALDTCPLETRCDPRTARCASLPLTCVEIAALGPTCEGNAVWDCSPDHYAAEYHVCPFGCRAGACDPGSETDLTLHTGFTPPSDNVWSASIPVCVATKPVGEEAGWVRDEVERAYNRFLSIEFVGWEPCGAAPTGVVLSFADDCRGFLVNEAAQGKPDGDVPIRLSLCRSYADNAGEHHAVEENEALIRLLARHQFGHALGFPDGTDARRTVMVRGVERGRESEIQLTTEDYAALYTVLGKPENRILTQAGACVTATAVEAGASLGIAPCADAAPEQAFVPANDWIQHADARVCVQSSGTSGDAATVAACAPLLPGDDQLFRLAHAQWRTPTHCVAPEHVPATAGTRLVTEACEDAGPGAQAWLFEIRYEDKDYGYYAQIRFADSDLCVVTPSDAQWFDPVELAPCAMNPPGDDPQVFLIDPTGFKGGGFCVNSQRPGGLLVLGSCGAYSRYFARGALEGANGTALALAGSGSLVVTSLAAPPGPEQLFDVYF
jgi:hypothetical protein